MVFKVELARRAEIDVAEAVAHIAEDSPAQAAKWFEGLFEALATLQEMPLRNPLIQEAQSLGRALRSLHYHSHRVVYEVDEASSRVFVVRVYHGARQSLKKKEFPSGR